MAQVRADPPAPTDPAFAADSWIRARSLGLLYIAGAAIGAISLVLPHDSAADDPALWSNTALAALGGTLLLTLGPRLPGWTFHAVWWIWVGLYVFYFFSRVTAALHVAFASGLYAITLAVRPAESSIARWL